MEIHGIVVRLYNRKYFSPCTKSGTLGRPILVTANMVEIKCTKRFTGKVFHYEVKIEPDKPKYLYRRIFKDANQKLFKNIQLAYDGKSDVYSSVKLFEGNSVSFIK